MSRLGELIRTLCPNGVEYKQIGELCGKVQRVSWDGDKKYEYIDLSSVDIKSHSIIQTTTIDKDNAPSRAQQIVREYDIIFGTTRPTLKRISYITKEYDGQVCSTGFCVVHINSDFVMPKWVYYLMCDSQFNNYVKANEEGANYPCIADGKIKRYEIPVPPMEVQEEIVRILDKFTALEAELEAELEARKKQYEHYRDTLLDFTPPVSENVIWMTMSELCELRNGYTPSKAVGEYWEGGTIPWFRMEDIRQNGRILSDSIQHITPEAVKGGKIFSANSFILATTATIGEHALLIADSLANQQFTNLKIRESLANLVDVKYFYYYLFIIDEWCKNNTNISGFASVDMTKLKKVLIPIPPLSEQKRIAGILDKFEALCTDLCEGLPAEIEARRRQYEHYRDRLLTFKRI